MTLMQCIQVTSSNMYGFTERIIDFSDTLCGRTARPRSYKTFFMLNSAEHEIFSANKYENANNSWRFHIY